MAENSKGAEGSAPSGKVRREQEGGRAVPDYESAAEALRAKTARLRELRMARDAASAAAPRPATVRKRPAQRSKSKPASLENWLKERDDSGRSR